MKHSRAFAVNQTANPAICPARNLQFFVDLCTSMRVFLSTGFLSRPTSRKRGIRNAPLLASTMQARLIKCLSSLGINKGESVHAFRAGNSILLRLLGVYKEEVARHIGWKSTALVDYYTQVDKVMIQPLLQKSWLVVLLTLETVLQQKILVTLSLNATLYQALRRLCYKLFLT